jgi:serine/threonine protein kinase
MGVVYRARDTVLDRVVAYKLLSANLKGNDVAVKYFLREARAAAQMAHVNIVTVFDAGEQDGEFFMAMEFVEGQTLKQLITRQGAFPEKLVRYIMAHVCRGLAYAHDRGLVHRDVKPGNIMLTRDRTVKIMDFGLAKFVEEVQAQHTRAIGTPYYMSPEQILGKELDGRSDLYSLGVSMFECATGQVPFSKGDLSYHHLHTEPPSVLELNPKIGEELAGIIHKCMAKSPDDRFKSAADLASFVKP